MKTDWREPNQNTFKVKNEATRHFEDILGEYDDPDAKEKKRIKKIREERLNHSEQGL